MPSSSHLGNTEAQYPGLPRSSFHGHLVSHGASPSSPRSRRRKMTGRFENKVVVVTGGTSGIGLATARRFAAEGAAVFVTGRRPEELDAAGRTRGGRVSGVRADMSKLADIDRLYDAVQQKHSQIDVLFTNAGGGSMLPLGAITEEHYEGIFGRNV